MSGRSPPREYPRVRRRDSRRDLRDILISDPRSRLDRNDSRTEDRSQPPDEVESPIYLRRRAPILQVRIIRSPSPHRVDLETVFADTRSYEDNAPRLTMRPRDLSRDIELEYSPDRMPLNNYSPDSRPPRDISPDRRPPRDISPDRRSRDRSRRLNSPERRDYSPDRRLPTEYRLPDLDRPPRYGRSSKEWDIDRPSREHVLDRPSREYDHDRPPREHDLGRPTRERNLGRPTRDLDRQSREYDLARHSREHDLGRPTRDLDRQSREYDLGRHSRERDLGRPTREYSGRQSREYALDRPSRDYDLGRPSRECDLDRPPREYLDRPSREYDLGRPTRENLDRQSREYDLGRPSRELSDLGRPTREHDLDRQPREHDLDRPSRDYDLSRPTRENLYRQPRDLDRPSRDYLLDHGRSSRVYSPDLLISGFSPDYSPPRVEQRLVTLVTPSSPPRSVSPPHRDISPVDYLRMSPFLERRLKPPLESRLYPPLDHRLSVSRDKNYSRDSSPVEHRHREQRRRPIEERLGEKRSRSRHSESRESRASSGSRVYSEQTDLSRRQRISDMDRSSRKSDSIGPSVSEVSVPPPLKKWNFRETSSKSGSKSSSKSGRARGRSTYDQLKEDHPGNSSIESKRIRTEISAGQSSSGKSNTEHVSALSKWHSRRPTFEMLHTRPAHVIDKKGSSGTPLSLQANYFKLRSVENWVLYQHLVTFTPVEERFGVRKALLKMHTTLLGSYIFDGVLLFTMQRLPVLLELVSKLKVDDSDVNIRITFSKELKHGDQEYMQFFHILMRKCLSALKLQPVGRNHFDPGAKIAVDKFHLELWPGYITSIHQHENDILMCAEITHKTMRRDTIRNLLQEFRQYGGRRYESEVRKAVIGLVVLTDYNNRIYRVDDINFDLSPESRFKLKENRELSYSEYYLEKYGIQIRSLNQPLLLTRSKPRNVKSGPPEVVYLIPELCRMVGLSNEMRTNFQLMRGVAEHTRVGPVQRIDKLINFSHRLIGQEEVKAELKQWDMEVASKLVEFQGRKLEPEKIVQGQEGLIRIFRADRLGDWTLSLRGNALFSTGTLSSWIVMCPENLEKDAQSFIRLVIRQAIEISMSVSDPYVQLIPDDKQGTYVDMLEEVLCMQHPQLVICIVSNSRADRYSAIKKKCLVERSVPSQVIVARSLTCKGAMSVATKIAMQINCKIGGALWTVLNPCRSDMVVGIDNYRDTMNRGIYYGALVASLNRTMSRYFSAVSPYHSGEELSNEISINLLKALKRFRETNDGHLPARIFIYRDGVAYGQTEYVYNHELPIIKDTLAQLYGSQDRFRLTFMIVYRKINTRIFTSDGQNPEPGTVVDDYITHPERFDFYLVSQSVRQGTVSPTSYNVIHDNSGLTPDMLQRFTYKLTHLYYNWTGTVRVPAVVLYARKLAMLVGQFLHRIPATGLDDTLYYL